MNKKSMFLLFSSLLLLGGCDNSTTNPPAGSLTPSIGVSQDADTSADQKAPADTDSSDDTKSPNTENSSIDSDNASAKEPAADNKDATNTASAAFEINPEDMFTSRDQKTDYDFSNAIHISLSDEQITCDNNNVSVSGQTVTLSSEGIYYVTGSLSDGMILVDADKKAKIQIILSDVTIHNKASAAIYVRQADKVFLTLDSNTTNTLSNGGTYTSIDENNIDSVIFSKDDLTINGIGTLYINAPEGHGIVSKDDLVFTGGTYSIEAGSHGICGKDSIRITDSDFTICSGKDGFHAENTEDASKGFLYIASGSFDITSDGDGISSSSAITIEDGSFHIVTGGGSANAPAHADDFGGGRGGFGGFFPNSQTNGEATETVSQKGIKATGNIKICGGSFTMDCVDDTVHGNSNLTIENGTLTLSSGDDGIHADADLNIHGGTLQILKSYEGLEGKAITISGGTIDLVASDDGINAADAGSETGFGGFGGNQFAAQTGVSLTITGGTLSINAGGDGIDSNGALTVTGGDISVDGPTNSGNGALDYNGTATITGGRLIAIGASGMAENFDSSSTQCSILVNTSSSYNAGTLITLLDSDGKEIYRYISAKSFNSVVISCPELQKGSTYTLNIGASTTEITMTDTIYGSGMGGFGGGKGGFGDRPGGFGDMGGFDKDKGNRPDRNPNDMDGNPQKPNFPQDRTPDQNTPTDRVPDGMPDSPDNTEADNSII